MSTTVIHIGKKRVQTLTASDGSPIPAGTVTAVANFPANLTVSVDPVTNAVTLTGVSANPNEQVTYSAPGYQPVTEPIIVAELPNLIVTDGPEQ